MRRPPRFAPAPVRRSGNVITEITSAVIDYDGAPALLVTGVEIIPTQTVQTLRGMIVALAKGKHRVRKDM